MRTQNTTTRFFADGSFTFFDDYRGTWIRTATPTDEQLAQLNTAERVKVIRRLETDARTGRNHQ